MPTSFIGQQLDWNDSAFLFVFCPNNSGTTILSEYIASQLDAYLPTFGNAEGQMVPTVKHLMRSRPWNKAHALDWNFIRREWETLSKGRLFVEGSPPNIMRPAGIVQVFGHDSTAIISICNPYQHIASVLRRYHKPGADLAKIASDWLFKAAAVRDIRDTYPQFPFLSHETFVRDPATLNRALSLELKPFHGNGKSGSEARGVQDLGARTTAFLNPSEIDEINEILRSQPDLVEGFGYHIRAGQGLVADLQSANPEEFENGRARRAAWAQGRKQRVVNTGNG